MPPHGKHERSRSKGWPPRVVAVVEGESMPLERASHLARCGQRGPPRGAEMAPERGGEGQGEDEIGSHPDADADERTKGCRTRLHRHRGISARPDGPSPFS